LDDRVNNAEQIDEIGAWPHFAFARIGWPSTRQITHFSFSLSGDANAIPFRELPAVIWGDKSD
jgi:hypothetical protein